MPTTREDWKPIESAPKNVPEDDPVLLFACAVDVTFDAAEKPNDVWKPVVGYLSKNVWMEALLRPGMERRKLMLRPTHWAEIPTPLPPYHEQ
jgi:hypothetical protein